MRPKVPASRKQVEAPDADKSDDSIKVGDIRASKRLSQVMQLLLKVRKKHLEAGEQPIERNKFIIAPDGYVPNSTVRSFVIPHKYARFVEKTLPSGKAEIVSISWKAVFSFRLLELKQSRFQPPG
ncbi:unnamed protein product [Dibothriocephalus latus]|uniref:Uncharacterized protein n=1 Tax=Dibothriocephalus latus TaxID=60516 RepID=A0A3P7Q1G4_DIBLA|nr:unnamed protein product [Dibothriocephalus latus]